MRKKPNLTSRMELRSNLLIETPEEFRAFKNGGLCESPEMRLEIGCGKGRFTVDIAEQNPNVLFTAVEKAQNALVTAMEKASARNTENIRFISGDFSKVFPVFGDGEIGIIYINFCDPWNKNRHAERRLTAPRFLKIYGRLLPVGGEIHFKTDDLSLFRYSLAQLEANGWQTEDITFDLHKNGPADIMTDYEAKFYAEGIKINRCVGVRTAAVLL
ncbi:MAG: tRNA (guanosine(46)-N7)-methyltransferase TrmB [Oscillospiraceae bacterium]|nr:tRNA (guanosine(46)-N7)-methyltransferase TrmB [Oscillospiraceae bacterium]